MKNWVAIAIGVVIFSVVALYIRVRTWASQIEYGITSGVKLIAISTKNIVVRIPLYFYNPTPIEFVVSNLNIAVYFNDYFISQIVSDKNYAIRPKENSTYPVDINVPPNYVLKFLSEQGILINDQDWLDKVNVKLIGKITVSVGPFTIRNIPFNVEDSLRNYIV
jgi:LEA14-like dessication related protein